MADLGRALAVEESAELLFNRSVVFRAAGLPDRARRDLLRAADLAPGDEDVGRALAEV